MDFNFISIFNYFNKNLIILSFFTIISIIAIDVKNCTIGLLADCPHNEICVQYSARQQTGHCVCLHDCPTDHTIGTTVKPLPIYSVDNSVDNSNKGSVIITTIFGAIISVLILCFVYYFGVRKGMFRDIWHRTVTARQFEHQLLDRSPQPDDTNDSEAIA